MIQQIKTIRKRHSHNFKLQEKDLPSVSISEESNSKDGEVDGAFKESPYFQEAPYTTPKQLGFTNKAWKQRALLIIYFITKFITIILTNSEKFKFSFLDKKIINAIGDPTADYEYYLRLGFIRQKYQK